MNFPNPLKTVVPSRGELAGVEVKDAGDAEVNGSRRTGCGGTAGRSTRRHRPARGLQGGRLGRTAVARAMRVVLR